MNLLEKLVTATDELETARIAIDCGFWPVPISRLGEGKKPIGEGWAREWKIDEIKSCFQSREAIGIGLVLGPGPSVPLIDIDLDSDGAINAMTELFGPRPEYTLSFKASRGFHWLYHWDERLQAIDSAVKHWPAEKPVNEQIEIRLGCGKMAQSIIPPSWHKKTKTYRAWVLPSDGNIKISNLPENVIQQLLNDLAKQRNQEQTIQYEIEKREIIWRGIDFDHPYLKAGIDGELEFLSQAQDGERNKRLHKSVLKITSLCASQGLDSAPILQECAIIAARLGLPKNEYDATIKSAYRWARENPRKPANLNSDSNFKKSKIKSNQAQALKTKVKATVENEAAGIIPEDEYSDLKFADIVIETHGSKFRYVEEWKQWAAWDHQNGMWVRSNVRHHEFFKGFAIGPDEYLGSASKIRAAASLCMSDYRILTTPNAFDSDPDYINLKNGVLDLNTMELLQHDPAFMATKQAAVCYDKNATCPKFLETLKMVQPDDEIREFLHRWLGTILTGKTLSESVVNYGDGANGKSTILESVGLVMGTYFAKMPRGFIAKTKTERHPAELITLCGARFALASETDISDAMDEAKIKMILGDGTITARGMHENFWSFTPTHKFAIAANHMPSIVGQDSGIWRRLAFVPWEYTIPEKDRKPEFEKYLFNNEASGILNWLIEGLKKYRQQGLAIPDKIKDSSQKVKDSSDWLSEFWGETLTTETKPGYLEENTRIRASQVYDLYKRWASANGIVVLPSSKAIPLFTKRVEDLGLIAPKPGNVRWYIGVRTKDESDHDTEIDKKLDENKKASIESVF